jgi:DAK2 domain fusion protein YloV
MNPTVIDGNLMKLLITNGTIALRNDHQRINELNVFPVPDGDTGSNMQSTMMSGVKAISGLEDESVEKVAKVLSRGLLMGARGNSGVILSQLFSGFAKVFKGKETATTKEFIEGFVQGVKQAYGAVINPVEGTILTVAREAADKAFASCENEECGLHDVMSVYIKEAYESLERTPDLLPVLKEAGVIDSGGAGFNVIIDGLILALEGEILEDSKFNTVPSVAKEIGTYDGEEDFGYCTEFIVQLKDGNKFNKEKFTKRIGRFGDSLVVVADEEICKVHIHTKTPGDVLNFGQQYGNFATLKIENMTLQHSETLLHTEGDGHDCGHEHAQYEQPKSKYGIITVVNGKGLQETFKEMGVHCIIDGGQTMNPSTEDFINAVEKLNCDHVIIIPNNGNVMLSAQHAAQYMEDRSVSVVPAKTIAQGYASLTMFDANQDLDEVINEMTELIQNVKTGEVTYAVRDTEVKGVKIKKDHWMGIANGEIISSQDDRLSTVCDLLKELVDEDSEIVTVMFGNDVEEDELELMMKCVTDKYPDVEVEVIEGNQNIYSYIIAVE